MYILRRGADYSLHSTLATIARELIVPVRRIRYQMKGVTRYCCLQYEIIEREVVRCRKGIRRKIAK